MWLFLHSDITINITIFFRITINITIWPKFLIKMPFWELEGFEPFRSLHSRIGRALKVCRKRQRRALPAISHNLACTRKRTILSDDPFVCRARRIRTFTMTESEALAPSTSLSSVYRHFRYLKNLCITISITI